MNKDVENSLDKLVLGTIGHQISIRVSNQETPS